MDGLLINHTSAAHTDRLVFSWEARCGPSSRIWTYKSRIVRNQPNEYVNDAKWHAHATTRVPMYPNQVSIYRKQCGEYRHIPAGNKASCKTDMDKTSYTSSVYEFMGLVRRGDNPNKKILIDIPLISYHHS